MKSIQDYERQFKNVHEGYGLAFAATIDIFEAVAAFTKYDDLPMATKESLQAICDMFNVHLLFNQNGRKMALTGIHTVFKVTYLYHDLAKSQAFLKKSTEWALRPGANHQLEFVESIERECEV